MASLLASLGRFGSQTCGRRLAKENRGVHPRGGRKHHHLYRERDRGKHLAIKGTALRNTTHGKAIVASAIEHMSVLNPMKELQKNGFTFTTLPVDSTGIVDLSKLDSTLTKQTVLTSVMYANNEIGTIEPIREISNHVHEKGMYLHVDAVAAAGRIPLDVQRDGIDLLTFSSNDLYGPQGAGALYVKPGVKLRTAMGIM